MARYEIVIKRYKPHGYELVDTETKIIDTKIDMEYDGVEKIEEVQEITQRILGNRETGFSDATMGMRGLRAVVDSVKCVMED